MVIKIKYEKCNSCGICIENCPINIIKKEGNTIVIDNSRCIHCITCVAVCPTGAIYIR